MKHINKIRLNRYHINFIYSNLFDKLSVSKKNYKYYRELIELHPFLIQLHPFFIQLHPSLFRPSLENCRGTLCLV